MNDSKTEKARPVVVTGRSITTVGSLTGLPAQTAPADDELPPGIARTRAALASAAPEEPLRTLPIEVYNILKISEIDPERYDDHPVRHGCAERLVNSGLFSDQRTAMDFVAVCFKVTKKERLTTSEVNWLDKLAEKFAAEAAAQQAAAQVGYYKGVLRRLEEDVKQWSTMVRNVEAQLSVCTAALTEPVEFYLSQARVFDGVTNRMPSAEICAARLHDRQLAIAFLNEKILPLLRGNEAAAVQALTRMRAEAAAKEGIS